MDCASGRAQVQAGGVLDLLSGTLTGNLTNSGKVSLGYPGAPSGSWTFTVAGSYTQTSGGLLVLDATSGGGFDQLNVTGSATLAGTFQLLAPSGFNPGPGFSLKVLSYGSRSGTFSSVSLPPLSMGTWDPRYDVPRYTNAFSLWVV